MATLSVGFDIIQNSGCGSLVFTDTSVYGEGSSGNIPSYSDVGSTKLEFYFANGRVVTITTFIPTAEVPYLTLYAADLGFTDIIPDQEVPGVVYTIYDHDGNVLGTRSSPYLFSCNFLSCFYGQVTRVIDDTCCTKTDLDRLTEMWLRFIGIQAAFEQNAGCMAGAIETLSAECAKFCSNNCNDNCA